MRESLRGWQVGNIMKTEDSVQSFKCSLCMKQTKQVYKFYSCPPLVRKIENLSQNDLITISHQCQKKMKTFMKKLLTQLNIRWKIFVTFKRLTHKHKHPACTYILTSFDLEGL